MLKAMAVVLSLTATLIANADAAEITLLSPGAVNEAIKAFIPAFTAETGTTVTLVGGTIGGIKDKIAAGTAADVMILPAEDVKALDRQAKLAAGSYTPVGREEFGVAVKAGAPHPDISTPAAFKATLLAAASVTYNNPNSGSLGGQIIDALLKQPEYAGVKIVLPAGAGGRAVAGGQAEIGIQAMGELMPVKGIDIIGTLPPAMAVHMDFAAGVLANAAAPQEALAFIRYITNAQAQAVWKAKGLDYVMLNLPQLLEQATALHQAGRIVEAGNLYRHILAQDPAQSRARYLLGVTRLQQGQSTEALELIGAALKTDPDAADMLLHYSVALQMVGRLPEALAHLDRSLARDPENPDSWSSRGLVLWQLERPEEALQNYDQALARRPQDAAALYNSGCILQRLNRSRDALARFDQALALQPEFAGALNNRGLALAELGLYDAALASYERALAVAPGHGDILFNRGAALYYLKRFDAALASYEAALAVKHPYALGGALAAAVNLCDWPKVDRLDVAADQAIAARTAIILPFIFIHTSADMGLQRLCAENFLADKISRQPPRLWNGETYCHDKIRIAYVSADFREHAVGYLIAEMIERHDRAGFEITGIALSDSDDAMRARFAASFDHFHDVRGRSDAEVAVLLKQKEIDIAVDLMGHTQGSRPGIFAHRPAPVQVSYLGYPGSMGADFIDYAIADAVVAPFAEQDFFREKIVHLPDCYQVNSSRVLAPPPSRREAGLPEEGFVFCCFNNSRKITETMFDVWMRLLKAVPQSVLWLVEEQGGASVRLQAAAAARGVDPARLVFAPRRRLPEHLARHRLADLFLDTLPYNAHATASFSLQAGVPLVTCRGKSFAGRVATSLLHGVGLPELSVESLEAYEALALKLACDPAMLRALRERLEQNRASQPLFDTARFTRHLEAAYTVMWQRAERGEPPQSFAVP